jgi:signal transduction histidine kinase
MFIKVLFIGVMLFGAVFIYWIRHKTLQRNKAKLESAIELRTKELYDSYRVIQQASLIVFHDLKTPLKFLESSIQSFKLNYEGFTKEEALQQLELLQFNIQQIYSFTANLLNWLINSNKINYVLNDTNISLVIHEIYMFYLPIAAFKNNKLQYNFKPVETVKTNEDILKIIIRNLLDNSIKYTNTGVITINIEQRVEGIEILIKDNGSGFNVKNSTNATIDDPNFPKINLGLQIVDDLCKKLNITCTINSQIGVGTFCYLLVPYYHTKET